MPKYRRVKSGCRTCRSRKVKCDETWPVCRCCSSSGRMCGGYGVWGGGVTISPSNSIASDLPRPIGLLKIDDEIGCFEWYMLRSAKKLPGAFFSHGGTSLLYQASTSNLVVRYAVLALGSAHRQEALGSNEILESFTLQQYNKAIRTIQENTSANFTLSLTITLFVYMEFLRGHYRSALTHLESGWRLFRCSGSLEVDGFLLTCFTRLLVQAKLAGQLMHLSMPRDLVHTPSYDTFRSPNHARRELENIMLRAFNHEHQEPLMSSLAWWRRAYDKTPSLAIDMTSFAYRLLKLYYFVATIIVGTHSECEMLFDSFNPTFLDIIRHSLEIVAMLQPGGPYHSSEPTSLKSVSDIGCIAPLYITATKCRIPRLRYQSIRLLDSVPHKEGIFDSQLAAVIAREVCRIEGQNCCEAFDILDIPSSEVLAHVPLPKSSRISDFRVELPVDPKKVLTLVYDHEGRTLCRQYSLATKTWTIGQTCVP